MQCGLLVNHSVDVYEHMQAYNRLLAYCKSNQPIVLKLNVMIGRINR